MRTPRTDVDEGPSVEVSGHAVEAGEQAVGQTLAHPVLLLTALLNEGLPDREGRERGERGGNQVCFKGRGRKGRPDDARYPIDGYQELSNI